MSNRKNHAPVSPSKMELLAGCPCFEQDENNEAIKDAAEEGTLLHKACETNDRSHLETEEQHDMVDRACQYRDDLLAKVQNEDPECWHGSEYQTTGTLTHGTVDFFIWSKELKKAWAVDYKFGRAEVDEAPENLQGMSYAHCIFCEFPFVDEVEVHFVLPRQNDSNDATFSREKDFEEIGKGISHVIERWQDPDKKPTEYEKSCLYCARKAHCSALGRTALQVFTKSTGFPMPSEFAPGSLTSSEDRGRAQVLASVLEDWCKQVKKLNAHHAQATGDIPPGFGLVQKSGRPVIKDVKALCQLVHDKHGLTVEDLMDPRNIELESALSISTTKLGKILKDADPDLDVKSSLQELYSDAGEEVVARGADVVYLQRRRKVKEVDILEGNVKQEGNV